MTTPLTALLDPADLADYVVDGYVRTQCHPDLPLTIYNYTQKAVYEAAWNEVTSQCRGLIVDDQGVVVARPFPKFFNYGQPEAPTITSHELVEVTDKADGSLGIMYPTPDGPAIATRGSFTSDQALHATEVLRDRWPDAVATDWFTLLFEIVYPANRIVLDYGDLDDLVYLGAVAIETGHQYGPDGLWRFGYPGPAVKTFRYRTLTEALAAEPRDNAEGLVVRSIATDARVKVKQDDYVELHKIVTGLNARTVWQHLVDGGDLPTLVAPLPDEFHQWVFAVADDLHAQIDDRAREVEAAYHELLLALPEDATRKQFAELAVKYPDKSLLFALRDGKPIGPQLWREVKPPADHTPARLPTEVAA